MLKFVSHVEVGVLNFVFTCYFHEVCFISTWEDWKAARGLMSAVTPKFVADADLSELTNPKQDATTQGLHHDGSRSFAATRCNTEEVAG